MKKLKKKEGVNEAQNKIADIRKILKTNKGKRIDSILWMLKLLKKYKTL